MKTQSSKISLLKWTPFQDARGELVPIEGEIGIPFAIARVYYIHGTPEGARRGGHAHKTLRQVAVAVAGSCEMVLDAGEGEVSLTINRPDHGVLIEPGVWHTMQSFSPDCVLLVLADQPYEEEDYIFDYDEFLQWIQRL